MAALRAGLVVIALVVSESVGFCQFTRDPSLTIDLSGDIQVDEADGETRAHLERVEAFLAGGQQDEAVETLRRVTDTRGEKLVPWDAAPSTGEPPTRFVTVRWYGHRRLAAWAHEAPEALALYRRRVDPLAERWTRQGIDQRDEDQLQRVTEQLFASSYGDDAAFALGEIYLAKGWHARARACWERISPVLRAPSDPQPPLSGPAEGPLWLALREVSFQNDWQAVESQLTDRQGSPNWLAYPDTDLDLADVRARLVLTSVLEGSLERARIELELLRRLHPDATGRMGGRTVSYADYLRSLLDDAAGWPRAAESSDWSTFAGNTPRNKILPRGNDIAGNPIWRLSLGPARSVQRLAPEYLDFGTKRPAESDDRLLSYHPLIVNGLVLVNDESRVRAVRLDTGQAWPTGTEGVLFRSTRDPLSAARRSPRRVGVPRFTMTVEGKRLFARMGSPVTSHPTDQETAPSESGYLVGLDLQRQGRLLPGFPIEPEGPRWSFEGAPLADAAHLYVALRRSDVRPQAHVACYRLGSGQLKWRKLICAAETPGHGDLEEITHNLLTLHEGTIYFNSNLGAVAALRAEDGAVQWITAYPRTQDSTQERGAANFYRDLNPCVCDQGLVFAAPADADHIFALDAATGQILWQTDSDEGSHGSHAVHLLGVAGGSLIVGGDRLWWIDAHTGKILAQFPDGGSGVPPLGAVNPRGMGRGLLAGNSIYWPTRDRIFVFSRQVSAAGEPKMVRQPIELDVGNASRRLSGGSLLMSRSVMLLVTAEEVIALSETGEVPTTDQLPSP